MATLRRMRRVRPFHVGVALLVLGLFLGILDALEWPRPPPHEPSLLSLARLLLGMPFVLFAPAFFLVPRVFRRDANGPGGEEGLDPGWTLLAAAGLGVLVNAVHFNLLRLAGIPIRWPALLALCWAESAAGLVWWHRRHADLRFRPWEPGLARGLAAAAVLVALFGALFAPHFLRDGSWYFYHPAIGTGWGATADPDSVTVSLDGAPLRDGEVLLTGRTSLPVELGSRSVSWQSVPVVLLVHADTGTVVRLVAGDEVLGEEVIAAVAPLTEEGKGVERYWRWGTAATVAVLDLPPQGQIRLDLQVRRPATVEQDPAAEVAVAGWSRLSSAELVAALGKGGFHHMHPFQLLNVTENIRWASEVAGDHVLPGRSPDGVSTLHQPPAWTYLYAPARELLCDQTVTAGLLLLLILLGLATVGLLGVRDEGTVPAPALGVALGVAALQHGRLMVMDGSLNFPDSLFALAVVVSVVALCSGRVRVFVMWALLASLLRYPGGVVVAMAGICLLAVDAPMRRRGAHALARFALGLAAFCFAMLLVGVASGRLDTWLFALYFETIPEHFHNNPGALPWTSRPLAFALLWAAFGGGVAVLGFPWRGRLSKVALGTALLYAPFLAFVDHFSHHYFLPLVGLAALSAAASIARMGADGRRRLAGWVLVAASAGLLAWAWLGRM